MDQKSEGEENVKMRGLTSHDNVSIIKVVIFNQPSDFTFPLSH